MRKRSPLQPVLLISRFQVVHLAGVSRRNPALEVFALGPIADRGDASQLEACVLGCLLDGSRDFSR